MTTTAPASHVTALAASICRARCHVDAREAPATTTPEPRGPDGHQPGDVAVLPEERCSPDAVASNVPLPLASTPLDSAHRRVRARTDQNHPTAPGASVLAGKGGRDALTSRSRCGHSSTVRPARRSSRRRRSLRLSTGTTELLEPQQQTWPLTAGFGIVGISNSAGFLHLFDSTSIGSDDTSNEFARFGHYETRRDPVVAECVEID